MDHIYMKDDTKERIDKPEAFMDEQKLKQAQQAVIGGALGVIGFIRSL